MGQSGGALGILRRLGACLVSDRIHVRMTGQAPGGSWKDPRKNAQILSLDRRDHGAGRLWL